MKKGILAVLDGGDGSGKATQTQMLVERLRKEGQEVETMDFPQYTQNLCGALIRECLDGKRGDFMKVDARIASVLYAADRFESKATLEQWLAAGKIVVLDRYVSANMMHQGAKIHDAVQLEDFLTWLDTLEHGVFGLPRPDIIMYLDVPQEDRARMVREAVENHKLHKSEAIDVAERDEAHQKAVQERAKQIVSSRNTWHQVSCTHNGVMRSREEIHNDVYACIIEKL